jgi:hypothetical protein
MVNLISLIKDCRSQFLEKTIFIFLPKDVFGFLLRKCYNFYVKSQHFKIKQ